MYDYWVVVIYIETTDGARRFEYVWREYGNPYLDTITRENDCSIKIVRMNLSSKPRVTSPDEAFIQLLNSYGAY